jgi:hypothetical protein
MTRLPALALALLAGASALHPVTPEAAWKTAGDNGRVVDDIFARTRRMVHAWLSTADPETLLLPDRVEGTLFGRWDGKPLYTPHNSGADNYPFLIVTSHLTEPALYRGRMLDMLRNEVRYTSPGGGRIPANLRLDTHELGPASLFGAGEYCKDGMVPVTELLGRTPWFYRMLEMTREFHERAPLRTRWGNLPASGAELNGDVLQTLARLIPMTGDTRLLAWAEQIGDAYIEEVLPNSNYLPTQSYDFVTHKASPIAGLGDHGNEAIVGLVLLQAIEQELGRPRATTYRAVLEKVLDRILATANPDGFIYRGIRVSDLTVTNPALTDCWGYVYASMYAYYQSTGQPRYRQAVLRVLKNLANYRDYDWTATAHTIDDLADSVEGALYLVAHEPVPEALDWIDHSIPKLLACQKPDGFIERWYGDGNWNRTLLLYALMKTQGTYLKDWQPGVQLGAVRDGHTLYLSATSKTAWRGRLAFDYARHRRILNLQKDYTRLNQWPEWYTVDENTLYSVKNAATGAEQLLLGSELKNGVALTLTAGETRRLSVRPQSTVEYTIYRAPSPITIDAKLDEPAWKDAPVASPFHFNWWTAGEQEPTDVRLLWDDENLYVAYYAHDRYIAAGVTERHGPVSKDDCVEIFLSPNTEKIKNYYTFEINAIGAMLNRCRTDWWQGGANWEPERVRYRTSLPALVPKRESPGDRDWVVELAIPLRNFVRDAPHTPPRTGDTWRLNLFRTGGITNAQDSSWSPIPPGPHSFHTPEAFGTVRFSTQPPPAGRQH